MNNQLDFNYKAFIISARIHLDIKDLIEDGLDLEELNIYVDHTVENMVNKHNYIPGGTIVG